MQTNHVKFFVLCKSSKEAFADIHLAFPLNTHESEHVCTICRTQGAGTITHPLARVQFNVPEELYALQWAVRLQSITVTLRTFGWHYFLQHLTSHHVNVATLQKDFDD